MTDKYYLYARKSTDDNQRQVQSIEAQLVELRAFARQNNLNVVEEIIERKSAKAPGRPEFAKMLAGIESGVANGILAWHPDRLARNSVDGGHIIYLVDQGLLQNLKFPTFWFEPTPQGIFGLNMMFSQSKYFVDSLSENTKRGLRQKCRNGWYPGPAPLGYMNDLRTKTIVIDKRTAPIVEQAFKLYSDGKHTFNDISDFLSNNGCSAFRGNKKREDDVKSLLSNAFYRGIFKYSDELWEGKHELFISQKLFDKVQTIMRSRSYERHKRYTWNSQVYQGLFTCSNCGMSVTAEHLKRKNKTDGKVREYIYYHCSRSSKVIKCKEKAISETNLDKQISELLIKYSLPKTGRSSFWTKQRL